jgi:calcium/calmodulin-dependent protein kinase I
LLPELRKAREARAKLKHAILAVSLRKRIAALQDVESDSDSDEMAAAEEAIPGQPAAPSNKTNVLREKVKDGSLFRSVALAAIKDHAAKKEAEITDEDLVKQANRKSFNSES